MEWIRGHFGHPPPLPPIPVVVSPVCLDHRDEEERRRNQRERKEAFGRVERLEENWRLTAELNRIERRGERRGE